MGWKRWLAVMLTLLAGSCLARDFVPPRPAAELIPLPSGEQVMSLALLGSNEMYVGTGEDLHRFDGSRWQSLNLQAIAPIRSLYVDLAGQVWVGGYDHFGILQRLPNGQDRFVDLTGQFADASARERIADIWEIVESDDAVYLRALKHVFKLGRDGKRQGAWFHAGRFGNPFVVDGQVWVQFRGEGGGFRALRDQGFGPIMPGSERYTSTLVQVVVPFDRKRFFVYEADGKLSWLDPSQGSSRDLPEQPAFRNLVNGRQLDAHHVAFSGDDGVLRVLNVESGEFSELELGSAYQPDILIQDGQRIVVIDDSFVYRLPWPVQWRIVDARHGLIAGQTHATLINGRLYVAGSAGMQSARYGEHGVESDFVSENWSAGEGWNLISDGQDLLFAETFSVLRIRGKEVLPLTPNDLYPRIFVPTADGLGYWIGSEHGVARLDRGGPLGWQLNGFTNSPGVLARRIVECGNHLFASNDRNGVFRVQLDERRPISVHPLEPVMGAPVEQSAALFKFRGDCYVSVPGSVLRFDGSRFVPDQSPDLQLRIGADELVDLNEAPDGTWWVLGSDQIQFKLAGGAWQTLLRRSKGTIDYRQAYLLSDGRLLVARGAELWQMMGQPRPMLAPENQQLRVTGFRQSGKSHSTDLALDGSAVVRYGQDTLQVDFSDGLLFVSESAEYAFRLSGPNSAWSPYSSLSAAQLSALQPGQYQLDLRVRRGERAQEVLGALRFEVTPRWYQSNGTRMVGLTAGIALLWALIALWYRGHLRRLTESNAALDRLVNERTAMWQQANRELKQQADRDGLTGVANRRVFDRELEERLLLAKRDGAPFALLMIDVDHFKKFNDEHGHLRGDEVLRQVAELMRVALAGQGLLARYGGEEFSVLLFDECSAARATGERLREAVQQGAEGITVSIGLACFDPKRHVRSDQLIDAADHALYEAKNQGRNCLIVASTMA